MKELSAIEDVEINCQKLDVSRAFGALSFVGHWVTLSNYDLHKMKNVGNTEV